MDTKQIREKIAQAAKPGRKKLPRVPVPPLLGGHVAKVQAGGARLPAELVIEAREFMNSRGMTQTEFVEKAYRLLLETEKARPPKK